MRLANELVSTFTVLIIAYLVLIHFTGFTKDIGQIGNSASQLATTFQGR